MTKTCLALAALLLAAGVSARAQTAAEAAPKPDAGTTAQAACIDENDHYKRNGKQALFLIELTNKCEARMICKVFANVSNARGSALGHGTIRLAPKSAGAAATHSWSMKVKMTGGNSMSDRECRVF